MDGLDLPVLSARTPLDDALEIMRASLRSAVLVSGRTQYGLITAKDILRLLIDDAGKESPRRSVPRLSGVKPVVIFTHGKLPLRVNPADITADIRMRADQIYPYFERYSTTHMVAELRKSVEKAFKSAVVISKDVQFVSSIHDYEKFCKCKDPDLQTRHYRKHNQHKDSYCDDGYDFICY